MNSLYIYIGIVAVLLAVFFINSKRNKAKKQDRKSRNFKERVAEKRAQEKGNQNLK